MSHFEKTIVEMFTKSLQNLLDLVHCMQRGNLGSDKEVWDSVYNVLISTAAVAKESDFWLKEVNSQMEQLIKENDHLKQKEKEAKKNLNHQNDILEENKKMQVKAKNELEEQKEGLAKLKKLLEEANQEVADTKEDIKEFLPLLASSCFFEKRALKHAKRKAKEVQNLFETEERNVAKVHEDWENCTQNVTDAEKEVEKYIKELKDLENKTEQNLEKQDKFMDLKPHLKEVAKFLQGLEGQIEVADEIKNLDCFMKQLVEILKDMNRSIQAYVEKGSRQDMSFLITQDVKALAKELNLAVQFLSERDSGKVHGRALQDSLVLVTPLS